MEGSLYISVIYARALKFAFYILAVTHMSACIWFPLACYSKHKYILLLCSLCMAISTFPLVYIVGVLALAGLLFTALEQTQRLSTTTYSPSTGPQPHSPLSAMETLVPTTRGRWCLHLSSSSLGSCSMDTVSVSLLQHSPMQPASGST